MSFGFSVGDILLVSQLAYKLYSTVTSGRRAAGRDLKELEDVLFSLRCALDHLGKAAKDISAAAANRQDASGVDMRQKLDTMIVSCRTTLEELDSVTKKYREAAGQDESNVVDDAADLSAIGLSTTTNKERSKPQVKQKLRENWMKIRWDVERTSLSEYRVKLQAHTDAINIVLNTFLWSATNRIEADGKVNAEKMHDLQNQALQSNTSLLKLVQDIHTMLLASTRTPSPVPENPPKPAPILQRRVVSGGWASVAAGHRGLRDATIHSISPYYGSVALMATHQLPNPTDKISTPFRLQAMQREPPSDSLVTTHHPAPTPKPESGKQASQLPAAIVLLNERRQSTGSKVFKDYQEKYRLSKPPPKPPFLSLEIPTVAQLQDGLNYIFRPFLPAATRQTIVHRDERKTEILRWTQGLDHLLNSWVSESTFSPSHSKEAKQAERNEMVELLIRLNGLMDESDDRMKRVFYQGTEQGGIDGVLDKLQRVSKSVRGMKEVEEFEDVRGGWKEDSQYWG